MGCMYNDLQGEDEHKTNHPKVALELVEESL